MSLLNELKKLKVTLPEAEVFVPEWNRSVTLRALSVKDTKVLRKMMLVTEGEERDNDREMCRLLAYGIVENGKYPLANEEGTDLLEQLSVRTLTAMTAAYSKLNQAPDLEGNSESRVGVGDSSSDLPLPSEGQLPN